MINDLKDRV